MSTEKVSELHKTIKELADKVVQTNLKRRQRHRATGRDEGQGFQTEADVLRDEDEAYGNKLREAGVDVTTVRYQGIIHDFVLLNALADTLAAHGATALAGAWLKDEFQ